ncbi:SPOR domain-containing protein [Solemya velesiana gill symbiont]|uniref:SPOR domain-containing protein n=1 Tax=Solemya velesiana gill symbiont TaxID=1918948 RepID=A0A1T2KV43_9GAMM|nr:SPOR domain-containing protein [Solemya velesiana gill symbiont]OOZ36610.1 hypothetical protein BOW51_06350 [Solemya velesiana gill symbiont]
MDEGLKKRLIGATVLVSLVVIFVPMLLDKEPVIDTGIHRSNVPPKPDNGFSSRVVPLQSEDLSKPPADLIPIEREEVAATEQSTEAPGTKDAAPSVSNEPASEEKPVQKPQQRVGLSAWVLQVGSFSNRDNAEKLVKELKGKNFAAFLEQVELKGRTLFRVRVGPEIDRKRAEQMLKQLNQVLKEKKIKATLKSYP